MDPAAPPALTSGSVRSCEGCHNDYTAHPAAVIREDSPWYNNSSYQHANVNGYTTKCTLCQGVSLEGGVGPACTRCHVVDLVTYPSGCVSCHNLPPNSDALAEDVRPNRVGRHSEGRHTANGTVCHNDFVYRTNVHFDFSESADVFIQASFGDPAGTGAYDPETGDCSNIIYHGGSGSSESPWYE